MLRLLRSLLRRLLLLRLRRFRHYYAITFDAIIDISPLFQRRLLLRRHYFR